MEAQIRKCGDDLVITFPQELASQLSWGSGDLLAAEVIDQGLRINRVMTVHERAMKIAREGMQKYRDALEALAKS